MMLDATNIHDIDTINSHNTENISFNQSGPDDSDDWPVSDQPFFLM